MRSLLLALAAFVLTIPSGCNGDECSSDSDCPEGRICRLNLCARAVGADTLDMDGEEVTLDCDPAGMSDLVMNEILADPGGIDVDANGSVSASGDEFVELINVSTRAVALNNVIIDVGGSQKVVAGVCLDPNGARVVFGSAGLPGLTNGGSTVSLLVDDQVVQTHTYGAEAGNDTSLTLSTQLDPTSAWVRHDTISVEAFSPGTCSNGNAFPSCEGGGPVEGDTTDGEIVQALCTAVPVAGDIVINEILADPTGLDANQDQTVSTSDDEFVELVNTSAQTLHLDGFTLGDSDGQGFTFPFNTCVPPGKAVVVFKKYEGTGDFGGSVVLGGATYALNNNGDAVNFSSSDGTVMATSSYGSEANDDQSITRTIDGAEAEALVKHSDAPLAAGARMSPGFCQSGSAFPDCGGGNAEEMDGDTSDTMDTVMMDTTPACGPAAAVGDLVINEIAVNPNTAGVDGIIDFNNDGIGDSGDDEFVELVSTASGAIDLTGVTISDNNSLKHTFGAVCLPAGEAVVVFGAGTPNITTDGAQILTASTGSLGLNNSNDAVTVRSPDSTILVTEAAGSAVGMSSTRNPDVTGAFVGHDGISATSGRASPGTCVEGAVFPTCVTTQ
ncbi:MAG: hypothetical protein ACI9MR_000183 [Myxococcota bacterium]|jgi:hypothetical protein